MLTGKGARSAVLTALAFLVGLRAESDLDWLEKRACGQHPAEALTDREEPARLQAALPDVQAVSRAFKLAAKIARPGVVHIRVGSGERARLDPQQEAQIREHLKEMVPEEQLERWLRRVPPGSASGIILDREGYILTNNHVVEGRDEIEVVLWDDRQYPATLVGRDPKTDLAVIKIDAPDLQPLKFGDSDALEVGDWVIAVGSPFGLSQTVTHGIVSATGRSEVAGVDITYQNFIQTDAAINPGNSGGPLLNLRGEVVGVNTAIAAQAEGTNAGIAFTIPSNMALKVANQLKATGKVTRGYLGILPLPIREADVALFGLPDVGGVLVDRVLTDSPAGQAGLQVEDVIIAVNDVRVRNYEQFRSLIADLRPEQKARLRVVRDRLERELTVRIGLQPEDVRASRVEPSQDSYQVPALGLGVRTVRPGMLSTTYAGKQGVIVTQLPAEPADRMPELGRFDLVVACNGRPVKSAFELKEALKDVPGNQKVELEVVDPAGDHKTVSFKLRPNQ